MKAGPLEGIKITLNLQKSLAFKKGDVLKARVNKVFNDHEVLLKIGKQQIQARTSVPLKEGQALTLKVTTAGQKIYLQVINPGRRTKGIVEDLRAVLKDLPLKMNEMKGQNLEQTITEKLEEVLLKTLQEPDTTRPEPRNALHKLALLQQEAIKQGFFVVPLPIQQEEFKEALLFWRRQEKEKGDNTATVVLKLNLSGHGNIMALFDHSSTGVGISVFVEDRALYKSLQSDRDGLKESLLRQGLELRQLEFYHRRIEDRTLSFVSQRT